MTQRLTLSVVGIKSPLDVGDGGEQRDELPARTAPRPRPRRPRPAAAAEASHRSDRSERPPVTDAPFYGTGRPLQTSIAFDDDCASRLDELARAAGVSANALAVAALNAGLPAAPEAARTAIVDERVNRAGLRSARIERNLRLPEQLRARIDELTFATRGQLPRATRADLVNAALRDGLPTDAEQATKLVAAHAQRVELAAAA